MFEKDDASDNPLLGDMLWWVKPDYHGQDKICGLRKGSNRVRQDWWASFPNIEFISMVSWTRREVDGCVTALIDPWISPKDEPDFL